MKYALNNFLQMMEGNWITQKTTFYLKINKICCNQFKYFIHRNKHLTYTDHINLLHDYQYDLKYYKNNIKQAENYSFNQNNQNNSGNIKKKNNKKLDNYNYRYSIYKENCIKIQHKIKDIEYIEYINTINQKFTTSIAFLKKSNKYIAISFSSNIKIKELNFK